MPKGLEGFQKGHPIFTTKGNFRKGHKTWNKGKKMPEISMEKHPNWKGGKTVTPAGYVLVYYLKYLNKKWKYIFEHRLVMEKHLGRQLKPQERIHHLNGKKSDNRIGNLLLCKSNSEHTKLHHNISKRRVL